ncbi:MAG TPA: amino acid adenylation domain-containing protein [Herpetosiphonaceae bacterium]
MTDFSERLAALSPEQRALFELRRKQKGLGTAQDQPIPRRSQAAHYPLSFDQMRLWFLYQLAPESSAYNIHGGVRLSGRLDFAAMERSINEIVRRHEILRTTFDVADEQPVQIVAPSLTVKLTLVDISDLPQQERSAAVHRLSAQCASEPFDLVRGPLIRTTLLRLADDEHILITVMHHIVTDRWSYSLFEQELATLYHACSSGLPSPLPELPLQFADFAIWQQQWMGSERMQAQMAYWKRQLDRLPQLHSIPTDHPRPAVQSFRGARHHFVLSSAETEGIRALSRQSGTTLFITLLTIFKVLLARQSGQTDMVVATPIANRDRPELQRLIGFFLNTLIFRSDLSGNPTFRAYLAQMRDVARDAYAHQDVPFEKLVAELRPERDTSRNPLYQITFLFLDFEESKEVAALPGMRVETVEINPEDSRFDLTLALWNGPQEINGFFEYSSDLFDPATIAVFAEHLHLLAEQIIANPDQPVFEIPCLTEAESHRLLVEWNATTADYRQDQRVPELIEAQAARTPDAIAIVMGQRRLTYRELNARANQLAHHLQALGAQPDTPIGLCVERSPELVIGLLGILKAGAAYVPLDPSYPQERLAFMLEDAGVEHLVTQQAIVDALPQHSAQVVRLDADWPSIAAQPASVPTVEIQSAHLAYLIYTSGTTGRPKAVQIEHRSLCNTLLASQERFTFQPDDVLPWIASAAFDIALFELLNPLLAGGTAIVLTQADVLDLPQLVQTLTRCTRLHAVPSLMRQIVQTIRAANLPADAYAAMRQVFVGGDTVPADLLSAMQAVFPHAQITVLYGPTETTIICTSFDAPRDLPVTAHPIGRPLPNVQLRLYDAHRQLVPIGVPGEIYLGGAGLARGYLHQPELTAEKFVTIDGQLWYRTGDLARYRADGTLEFMGRTDNQVKVRGFRIELGEIEAVLRQHEAVRDAAAIVHTDGSGDARLVAYVVEQRNKGTKEQGLNSLDPLIPDSLVPDSSTHDFRAYLNDRLPGYMVPAEVIVLDALPLTAHGKLDRAALPPPDATLRERAAAYVAPRTPLEAVLAQIWAAVLGREAVSVHDDFFALGGHSLLATQVVTRIRAACQVEIQVRALFDHPTIAALAHVIEASGYAAPVPIVTAADDEEEEWEV